MIIIPLKNGTTSTWKGDTKYIHEMDLQDVTFIHNESSKIWSVIKKVSFSTGWIFQGKMGLEI